MAKWIAAEKARAGVQHAVVYPNMTGRTKERIAQSKRDRAGSLATVDYSHKWCGLVSSARLVCKCPVVFLCCYVCFVLFVWFSSCSGTRASDHTLTPLL